VASCDLPGLHGQQHGKIHLGTMLHELLCIVSHGPISQKAKLRIKKTRKQTEFRVLQWQKNLEEKEKVTRSAIFDSRKYLLSQKYVRMFKKISFIYLCFIYMVYSQIKGKRFQGKITNFFQIFLWKRITTKKVG
jgi:hypothetical protein